MQRTHTVLGGVSLAATFGSHRCPRARHFDPRYAEKPEGGTVPRGDAGIFSCASTPSLPDEKCPFPMIGIRDSLVKFLITGNTARPAASGRKKEGRKIERKRERNGEKKEKEPRGESARTTFSRARNESAAPNRVRLVAESPPIESPPLTSSTRPAPWGCVKRERVLRIGAPKSFAFDRLLESSFSFRFPIPRRHLRALW